MKVSRKQHEAGFTPCDLNDKGKCTNPVHWETKIDWYVPDVMVRAILERMQRDKFTVSDVANTLAEFVTKEGLNLYPGMDAEIVKEIMRTVKRRGIVSEMEVDRGQVQTYKWCGKTGGMF